MFIYWPALYLSTLITKFTQHQIEHGVLQKAFNGKISPCATFAYCIYIDI